MAMGVLGYMFIDDYNFVDALFMTVITVSTVGFNIIDPLNPAAKIFTVFLILSSIGTFMYAATIITKFIVDGQFLIQYKHNQVYKKISKLSGHVIVCGYGRNGKQAVQKLIDYNKKFVVVEGEPGRIEDLSKVDNILFIEGNATDDSVLLKAGIERASHVITTLPKDSENVFVVLSCRQFNKDIKIISRAAEENSRSKLKVAGADNVIMPTKIGGDHMASLVVTPDVVEFLDNLTVDGNNHTNIKEVHVEDVVVEGKKATIRNFDLGRKTGVTVIGLKTPDGEYHVNPDGDMELLPGTKLIVLGKTSEIDKLADMFDTI